MSLSSVAGILDGYGGWHTVVAPRKSLRHHVRPGQLLLVVPDYKVKEPVPWNNIPGLIRRVELHILWWINSRKSCKMVKVPGPRHQRRQGPRQAASVRQAVP
jgi:hypothetical protein